MINWVTPDSTGAVRLSSLEELPPVESPTAIREVRVVTIFGQVKRLVTEDEVKKFLEIPFAKSPVDFIFRWLQNRYEAKND